MIGLSERVPPCEPRHQKPMSTWSVSGSGSSAPSRLSLSTERASSSLIAVTLIVAARLRCRMTRRVQPSPQISRDSEPSSICAVRTTRPCGGRSGASGRTRSRLASLDQGWTPVANGDSARASMTSMAESESSIQMFIGSSADS